LAYNNKNANVDSDTTIKLPTRRLENDASPAQNDLLKASKEAARELGSRGKALTGLIGELLVCQDDSMMWEPSDGYDAKINDLTVQIKTSKTPEPGETMGWFEHKKKKGYIFDVAVYVELDQNYDTVGIWHMGVNEVKSLEETETSTWGLRISRFKGSAERVI
jgi:hypothetical protein